MPSTNPLIQVRVDPVIKDEATKAAKGMGIPLATLINAFVTRLAMDRKMPFDLVAPEVPTELTITAMKEAEAIIAMPRGKRPAPKAAKQFISELVADGNKKEV